MLQPPLFKEDLDIRTILIVINPPKKISDHVRMLKDEIAARHGTFDSYYSTPHITVTNFQIMEYRVENVLPEVFERASQINPFEMVISGFSSFMKPNKNTFYMKTFSSSYHELVPKAFKAIKKEIVKTTKFYVVSKPHLTIAKGLSDDLFRKIRQEYGSKTFSDLFEVQSLTVLKYMWRDQKYQKVGEIELGK